MNLNTINGNGALHQASMPYLNDDVSDTVTLLKAPLSVDAGGSLTNADGVFVPLPQLLSARLVARLGNDLAATRESSGKAKRFMLELLDSVECLTAVAEEHGPRTLADLFYLHSAINAGGFVDSYPNESQLVQLVKALPSAPEWLAYVKTESSMGTGLEEQSERLFVGVYPCGLVFADRWDDSSGDYARLGFLPYDTLQLEIRPSCPADLRGKIEAEAAKMQARKGEQFQISTAGQQVTLGTKA